MSWKICWDTVLCALIATVVIELMTYSFSRILTIQNAINLKHPASIQETMVSSSRRTTKDSHHNTPNRTGQAQLKWGAETRQLPIFGSRFARP
jgi:hypothetical protein